VNSLAKGRRTRQSVQTAVKRQKFHLNHLEIDQSTVENATKNAEDTNQHLRFFYSTGAQSTYSSITYARRRTGHS